MPRIDELDEEFFPSLAHELAAMNDDLTVRLSVDQIRRLIVVAALGGYDNFSARVDSLIATKHTEDLAIIAAYQAADAAISAAFAAADTALGTSLNTAIGLRALKTNNLSDLPSAFTARTNLGAIGNLLIQPTVFLASGTFTPQAGTRLAMVEAQAPGGGGGPCQGATGAIRSGTGGGAGEFALKWLTIAQIGASKAVAIGAAGTGGLGATPTDGTDGGDTTFGSTLCVAKGGKKGSYALGQAAGGDGGTGGTGDMLIPGQGGQPNISASIITVLTPPGGEGGYSVMGKPGKQNVIDANVAVNNAIGYGAGGSGGNMRNAANNINGGNAGPGWLRVWEFG